MIFFIPSTKRRCSNKKMIEQDWQIEQVVEKEGKQSRIYKNWEKDLAEK